MGFRISKMSALRAIDPRKFDVTLRKAIIKHRGVAMHIAQDMDVGISTIKRWIGESPGLDKLMVQTRKVARKSPPKAA